MLPCSYCYSKLAILKPRFPLLIRQNTRTSNAKDFIFLPFGPMKVAGVRPTPRKSWSRAAPRRKVGEQRALAAPSTQEPGRRLRAAQILGLSPRAMRYAEDASPSLQLPSDRLRGVAWVFNARDFFPPAGVAGEEASCHEILQLTCPAYQIHSQPPVTWHFCFFKK
jgi:hypothetical protein